MGGEAPHPPLRTMLARPRGHRGALSKPECFTEFLERKLILRLGRRGAVLRLNWSLRRKVEGMPEVDSGLGQLEFRSTQFRLVTRGTYLTTLCLSFLISDCWCQEVQVCSGPHHRGDPVSSMELALVGFGAGALGKSGQPGKPGHSPSKGSGRLARRHVNKKKIGP